MKPLLFLALLAVSAFAQSPAAFAVSKTTTLNAGAEVITLQGNQAAGVKLVKVIALKGFDASCSVACTITLERDGTAATTTALASQQLNGETLPSTALAFSASNASVGVVLSQYTLTAGGQIAINLQGKFLYTGFENVTVRTSSITGVVNINVQYSEQ